MKKICSKLKSAVFSVIVLYCSLMLCTCYSWYEDKIDMDTKTPKSSLEDLLFKEKEITSLTAPVQLIVSKGVYSGSIKLHWDEVPYATSYRIERAEAEPDLDGASYKVPDEGDFEVINKYVYTNNYTDLILASPSDSNKEYQKRYYYRVSAENIKVGLESSEFTAISEENSGWLLAPPAFIDAAKGEDPDYIEVSWSPVENASKYLIYRSEKSNGLGMEQLDSVTGNITTYRNELSDAEKGVEFYYKVCAVLGNGSESAFTGLAMGYSAKKGAPLPPQDVVVDNAKAESTQSLTVKWTADPSGTKTYNLYRTSSEESIYTLISTNIQGGTFTDNSITKTGVKYYYYVQSVEPVTNDEGVTEILKSKFSNTGPDSKNPAVGWLLGPPSYCEVTDALDISQVSLRWTPSTGYDEVEYIYNIYSHDTLDGTFELFKGNVDASELQLGEDGYYTLTVERKGFYRITTINSNDRTLESAESQTIAPCPHSPQSVYATKTEALDGLDKYTPNTNGVYPVKISWNAPAGENPYGYYVYRSTKPDASFRKITDNPITDGVLYFIDDNETARPGTIYYYKVVSLNMLMQGKNANTQNEDSIGYGALTRDQWFREYNATVKKSQSKLTLMHKGSTDALGSESAKGDISGTLSYNAKMDGLGARITMHYENYAEFYVLNNPELGVYFLLTGDTNTSANMSANGSMDGTNTAALSGMYPGYANYGKLEIKGGGAGGGSYTVCTKDKKGNIVLSEGSVSWTVGEE